MSFKDSKGRQFIMEVEATVLDIDAVRLKYHGLPGDTGPDLIMNFDLVRQTINALQKCLPLPNISTPVEFVIQMLMGRTLFRQEIGQILEALMHTSAPDAIDLFYRSAPAIKKRMPFPVFNLAGDDETTYMTYHRGFRDGWNSAAQSAPEQLELAILQKEEDMDGDVTVSQ
jgi:hypothetical protein